MNETEALLEQLRGIEAPTVSQVPAPGWWLSGLLLLLLLYLGWRAWRSYQRRAWVREAQRELDSIRQLSDERSVADSLSAASRLARRVSLAVRPRSEIAGLHGDLWLAELDKLCGRDLFSSGYGRLLQSGPYQRQPEIGTTDLQGLFEVLGELIRAAGKSKRLVS